MYPLTTSVHFFLFPKPWEPPFYFLGSMNWTYLDSTFQWNQTIFIFCLFHSASWVCWFICIHKFGKFSAIFFFNPTPFSSSGVLMTWILGFLLPSQRSQQCCSFFAFNFLFAVQIVPSPSSLILSSGFSIMLWAQPLRFFFILVIVYLLLLCWDFSISFLRLSSLAFVSSLFIIACWSFFVVDDLSFLPGNSNFSVISVLAFVVFYRLVWDLPVLDVNKWFLI